MNLGTIRKTHATELFLDYGDAAAAESLGMLAALELQSYTTLTHERTESSPYRDDQMTEEEQTEIDRAIEAERERCSKLVELH